ncbi:MAG: hypothetical protein FWG60_01025, partial [Methanomassiliicoccaceae archaeon]|nr:hypothetical protein [Methanomassiliicoccaceae archaeon]
EFTHWTLDSGTAPMGFDGTVAMVQTFTTADDCSLTAGFTATGTSRTLTVTASPATGGTITVEYGGFSYTGDSFTGSFKTSESVTVSAAPAAAWSFSNWETALPTVPSPFDPLSDTNAFAMSNNYTLNAVFFTGSGSTLVLATDPADGSGGSITVNYGGFTATVTTFSHEFAPGTVVSVEAVPNTGALWSFSNWSAPATGALPAGFVTSSATNAFSMDNDYDLTAVFLAGTPPDKYYYITATADSGSTISPAGKIAVQPGANMKFAFSAKEGFRIVEVLVDGKPLSQSAIDSGSYTFTKVNMNHSIVVKSIAGPRTDITLRIDVMEGSGYAEYSVNGGPFIRYTGVVALPDHSDIVVRAYADDGYSFDRWETPAKERSSEISFSDLGAPLYLELYFKEKSTFDLLLWVALFTILLLVLLAVLIWYFLFYKRRVDVIKVGHSTDIVGKDKVYKKSAYSFEIKGGFSGAVSYRVGEEGEWKTLLPGPDGKYTIPRGEITESVTIECK